MALQQRYRIIHTARLVLEQNGEVLFLAQTKQNGNGFSLPGGKIQGAEFAKDALIRETKEEIGLDIKKKQLVLRHVSFKKLKSVIEIIFFFYTDLLTGDPIICEPEKFKEIRWFMPKDYPGKMPPIIKQSLKRILDGKLYTEFPKPKKSKNNPITEQGILIKDSNDKKIKKSFETVKSENTIKPFTKKTATNTENKKKKKTIGKQKEKTNPKQHNASDLPTTQLL